MRRPDWPWRCWRWRFRAFGLFLLGRRLIRLGFTFGLGFRFAFGLGGVGLGIRFGFRLGVRFCPLGGKRFAAAPVVGNVPAGALELDRRRGNQSLDGTS